MDYIFDINFAVTITDIDIDDIMAAALEGGITYWCSNAEVVGEYLGEYASEQISRGGTLILDDAEDDERYELTREKFLNGFKQFIIEQGLARNVGNGHTESLVQNGKVDTSALDAADADCIVQYALFGELVFG